MSADPQDPLPPLSPLAEEKTPMALNVGPSANEKWGFTVIVTGFGVVGLLGGMSILLPEAAVQVEVLVSGAIAGIMGFLAGRKSR